MFGKLLAIRYTRMIKGHSYWLCICGCNKEVEVRGSHLRSGDVKSCGCLSRELASKRLSIYATSTKHKGSGNPAWRGLDATYSAFHSWLTRNYGKEKCEHCGSVTKRLDWALIKGKRYQHNRDNFMTLCRGCHIKYDKR